MSWLRRFLLGVCLTAGLVAQSASEEPRKISILTVQLGIQSMGDPLLVQQRGAATWVPLGELARQLYLGLTVDAPTSSVDGYVIEEKNRFHLDLKARTVLAEGRTLSFGSEAVFFEGEECYVDLRLLEQWLPLKTNLIEGSATLEVRPLRLLPVQARWKREKDAMTSSGHGPVRVAYEPQAHPYAPAAAPFVDQSLSWAATRQEGKSTGITTATTFLSADLLWAQSMGYLSTDFTGKGTTLRGNLGRRDPTGQLLGPLGAREVVVGSVDVPGIEYISRSTTGNGVLLSNFALNQDQFFDRKTFQGELPLDWDVQLFHNGTLVGFQLSRADGRYSFPDVPLNPGANNFVLLFHGPLGQRREETLSVLTDPGLGSGGFLRYRVSYDRPQQGGGPRTQATFDWGVNRFFVPYLSLVDFSDNSLAKLLTQTGARGQVAGVGYQLGWSRSDKGGDLYEASFKGQWDKLGWSLRHLEGRDFESEVIHSDRGFLQSRTQANLLGSVQTWGQGFTNLRLELKKDTYASGLAESQASFRAGHTYQGLYLTNGLVYTDFAGIRNLGGELLGRKNLGGWMLQGQAGYSLSPKGTLDNLGLSLDSLWAGNHQVQFGLVQALATHQLRLNAGLRSTLKGLDLGANVGWARTGGWTLNFQLRTSFGRDPGARRWEQDPRPVTSSGSVAVLVFIDRNGNGVMDPGEKPLEGASFLVDGVPHPTHTDATGHALLMHLPTHRDVDIAMNVNDLEDPSLSPVRKGLRFVPRPGAPLQATFPVVVFGEASGTLRLRGPQGVKALAGVTLELVDAQERIIQRQTSSYDGFFDFNELAPGTYRVQIPDVWLNRRHLKLAKPMSIQIDPSGSQLQGLFVELVPEG